MGTQLDIVTYLNNRRILVEEALERFFPQPAKPFSQHIEAMRYSLFAGGKRIRPILCLAAAECAGDNSQIQEDILPVLCALECIHTYSLVHDDLPAMDNDALRRGKPTNHILFGEAGAILAGDGLLTLAFELLADQSNSELSIEKRLKISHVIAQAAGSFGMVGGQSLDIAYESQTIPFETLQAIHRSKTGALLVASLHAGAIAADATLPQTRQLIGYGEEIGLAFQIIDDLLDVTATTEQLGKTAGSDEVNAKATYPGFFGIAETRRRAQQATQQAKTYLTDLGEKAEPLLQLADYIYTRSS